jgi:hypothetical protein
MGIRCNAPNQPVTAGAKIPPPQIMIRLKVSARTKCEPLGYSIAALKGMGEVGGDPPMREKMDDKRKVGCKGKIPDVNVTRFVLGLDLVARPLPKGTTVQKTMIVLPSTEK